MKKTSIVFITESLRLGGAEKSLVTLLSFLDYNKYDINLILFVEGGVFDKSIPSNIKVIKNLYPKISIFKRIKYKLLKYIFKKKYHNSSLFWEVTKNSFSKNDKSFDVAIAYSQGLATYYTAKKINAMRKYAWVNTDYKMAGYKMKYDINFYNSFNKIIAVSPDVKKGLETELVNISKSIPIEIIKDITDKKNIKKKSKEKLEFTFDKDSINILTVGRLSKDKGLHLAIESCKLLIEKGYPIRWYIVGEGSERIFIEKLMREYNIEKFIKLVGMKDNPYPYMNACDIYVQTSLFEGLGLTVIEASYLNKPIVTTNFPTAFGIIKDGETGLIAEMNSESIVEKIERFINDTEFKEKVIKNLNMSIDRDKEYSLKKIEILPNES